MKFKSILTVITHANQAQAAITAAARVALANDGHLDVLALGVDQTQLGYSYMGSGAILTEMSLERAEDDAKAAEVAARSALTEQSPAVRWTLEAAVAHSGGITSLIAHAASFADLVVQTLPYGKDQGYHAEAAVEAALFQGHAPVLVVPTKGEFGHLANPRRIILAWNQSAEALTAAKHALPLLCAAEMVDVTIVDPPSRGTERSDPGGMLCQFLVRHGVKAEVTVLSRSLPEVADVLAQHALDRDADMLVMGAYGHSRLREAVLGGATRAILERSKIPVLLAH
ncbi:MAG: universal stress protein [Paracoccaceae bacterium]